VKTVANDWGQMKTAIACPEGTKCSSAHSKDEVLYHPHIFKTLPCEDFQTRGAKSTVRRCHRFYCPFAHGEQELRESPLSIEERQALVQAAQEQFPSSDCCKVCAPDQLVPQNGEAVGQSTVDAVKNGEGKPREADNDAILGGVAQTAPSLAQAVCSGCVSPTGGLQTIQHAMPVMVQYFPMAPVADGGGMQGDSSNGLGSPAKQGMQAMSSPGYGMTPAAYPATQDDYYSMGMVWPTASFMTPCVTPFVGQQCAASSAPVSNGKSAPRGEYDYFPYDTSAGTFLPAVPPFPVAAQCCQAGYASPTLDMTGGSMMSPNYYCHWSSGSTPKASGNGWQDNEATGGGYAYQGAGCSSMMMNGYQLSADGGNNGQIHMDSRSKTDEATCNMEQTWQRPPSQKWLLTTEELLKERDPPVATLTDLWYRLKEENLSFDFDEPGSPTLHRLEDELKAWPTHFAVQGDTVTLAQHHATPEGMQMMG